MQEFGDFLLLQYSFTTLNTEQNVLSQDKMQGFIQGGDKLGFPPPQGRGGGGNPIKKILVRSYTIIRSDRII